jgi:1-pyrroline-5-carboxylate dehydrogenase
MLISLDSPFRNEPFTDFSNPHHLAAMENALRFVRSQFGRKYPLVIGGEKIFTDEVLASHNPARHPEIVGYASCATNVQAQRAVKIADKTFASWRKTAPLERAEYLSAIAASLRERKFEFAAWMVFEVSKTWAEADADVAEAIDFCEFYARESLRIAEPQPLIQWPGERGEAFYIPLGAGVSIPPWNFPLAILCGLTVAPVVCGNTTVLKPSPRAPIVAAKFMEVLESVALPSGVVNFVTGHDAEIGDALTEHSKIKFIAFTGSKDVGLRIAQKVATRQPGQNSLKRAILEMGGKDTIIVDETADLDAAADGIVASAFGFQGQKCSACSRVVAVEDIHDSLLDKVREKVKTLRVGDPAEPSTQMGAMIDGRALDKVRAYLEIGAAEGERVLDGETDDATGYFARPAIFKSVAEDARLAQEEIFGPVLAFIQARDFDDALRIANNTEYGLTGGVYSQHEKRLLKARDEFEVGNLYLNRKITGALVGVHPFGGFKMSGTDSKAGGRDYLLQFLQLKCVAEKL